MGWMTEDNEGEKMGKNQIVKFNNAFRETWKEKLLAGLREAA